MLTFHSIRALQELRGHAEVATTQIYPDVLQRGPAGVQSPMDRLDLSNPAPAGRDRQH